MTRHRMLRRLAEDLTRPLDDFMHQPVAAPPADAPGAIFAWFEDTSTRRRDGGRGIAGLPESLLPYTHGVRVVERKYADGHPHLLSAVHIECRQRLGECIAALYTAALSVGTIAWIGTGPRYAEAWREMYP